MLSMKASDIRSQLGHSRLAMRTDEIRASDRRGSIVIRLHDYGQLHESNEGCLAAAAGLIWCFNHSATLLHQDQAAIIISGNQAQDHQPRLNRLRDCGSFPSGRDLTKRHPFLADGTVL